MIPKRGQERVQRFLAGLVPVLFLLLLIFSTVGTRFQSGVHEQGLTEEAYTHLAVAGNLVEGKEYTLLPGQPVPPLKHALWRVGVGLFSAGGGGVVGGALMFGVLCTVLTLMYITAWSRMVSGRFLYIVLAGIMVALSPGFIAPLLCGSSQPLATLLVVGACVVHAARCSRNTPLPMASAVLLGLAGWINVFLPLLWLVLVAHAWSCYRFTPMAAPKRMQGGWAKALSGLGLMALIMAPMFLWNFSVIQVPWPPLPGIPISGELWAERPLHALLKTLALIGQGVPESYGRLGSGPLLGSAYARGMILLGLVMVALAAVKDTWRRGLLLPLFLLVLAPLLGALCAPYLGWSGVDMLFRTFEPLCVATAVAGFWLLIPPCQSFLKRTGRKMPAYAVYVLPGLLLVGLLIQETTASATLVRKHASVAEVAWRCREGLLQQVEEGTLDLSLVATDQPGWVALQKKGEVLDLSGEFARREILWCIASDGTWKEEELRKVLSDNRPTVFILWDQDLLDLDLGLALEDLVPAERARQYGLPRVARPE